MAETMQASLEVTRAIRKMDRHLQAAAETALRLETAEQQAQALQYLMEALSKPVVVFRDSKGRRHERPSFLREVMSRRARVFQGLLDAEWSYARAAALVGLTKGGFQSALTRESNRTP